MKFLKKRYLFLGLIALFFAFDSRADSIPATGESVDVGFCSANGAENLSMNQCFNATQDVHNFYHLQIEKRSDSYYVFSYSSQYGYWTRTGTNTLYSCDDINYPILEGSDCFSNVFEIDDDAIASLNFKVESSQALVDEMIEKNSELGNFIESTENAFDSALDSTASGMATVNAMEKQVETALEFKELNPDSDLIRSFADDMEANLFTAKELSNQNLVEVEGIVEIQDNANTIFNDNNQIIGFAQDGIQYIYGASEEILLRVDNQTDYDQQISIVDSNYDSILTNSNTAKNNNNSLDTSKNSNGQTQPQVKHGNINSNNSSIQDKVNKNNSMLTGISNASNNGEVCSGSKCVPVPDVEDEKEKANTPEHRSNLPYESVDDAFTGFVDKIDSAPVFTAMNSFNNIIVIPNSSCPILTIDLSMTPIGVISTNIHCSVFEATKSPLSIVMHIVFLFAGFRIVGGA